MNKKLREILVAASGGGDLWKETEIAASILLAGGYPGHDLDIENIEDVRDCIELERLLSQGSWYFQKTETWRTNVSGTVDLCPECKVYCGKRFIDGMCE